MHFIPHAGYCRCSPWLTDSCSVLKFSLYLPQSKQEEWTVVSVNSSCFYSRDYWLPFCDHKATLFRRWQLFQVSIHSGTCTWGYITKHTNMMKLKKLDTCYCCVGGGKKTNNRTKRTQNQTLSLHVVFVLKEIWEHKMVVYCFFLILRSGYQIQVTFAPAMVEIVVKYLFCSMILEWSALLESPRTWDRRKMAIISCMQELRLGTNLTTISSQSVVFEISAKF